MLPSLWISWATMVFRVDIQPLRPGVTSNRNGVTAMIWRNGVRTWLFTSLGDLSLDKSFNMLEKDDSRFIIQLVVNTLHRDFIVRQSPRQK